MSEEISFCMVPVRVGDKFNIFPIPCSKCHCKNSDKKHFEILGRYNEDKTQMIPVSQLDVENLEEYVKSLSS